MQSLRKLSDSELLIAAGLASHTKGPGRYLNFLKFYHELQRRKLQWTDAKAATALFKRTTGYPKRGWQLRYIKLTRPSK